MIEYRVWWEASSHVGFKGSTHWTVWDGDDGEGEPADRDRVEVELGAGGAIPPGLEMAINGAGFGWWVETREVPDA